MGQKFFFSLKFLKFYFISIYYHIKCNGTYEIIIKLKFLTKIKLLKFFIPWNNKKKFYISPMGPLAREDGTCDIYYYECICMLHFV